MTLPGTLTDLGLPVIAAPPLREYTTFKLGGPCRAIIFCSTPDELLKAARALRAIKEPFLLMGFGSNILASDQGVDRIIIRYSSDNTSVTYADGLVTVDASGQLDALVLFTLQHGLQGMEKFNGIPGTVGGALVGNAGAYGQQISDNLEHITVLSADDQVKTLKRSQLTFQYRDSSLKHDGSIVLSAAFRLLPGGKPAALLQERKEIISTREEKHGRWQDNPCAGSFFRNVLPSSNAGRRESAGWFLEQAGCKELNINGAHSYRSHANIITREESATANDVYHLAGKMTEIVKQKFALQLEREVRLLGAFTGGPQTDTDRFW